MASRAQHGHAAVVGLLLRTGYLGGVFSAMSVGLPYWSPPVTRSSAS